MFASAEVQLREDEVSHILSALTPLQGSTTQPSVSLHPEGSAHSGTPAMTDMLLPPHPSLHVGGEAVWMVSSMSLFQQLKQPLVNTDSMHLAGSMVEATGRQGKGLCLTGPACSSGAMGLMRLWQATCERSFPGWPKSKGKVMCCKL